MARRAYDCSVSGVAGYGIIARVADGLVDATVASPTSTPDYQTLMTEFVHDEVTAGRCAAPAPVGGKYVLQVEMVVLVTPGGDAVRIVPKAIHCPTVEQFAAGVVQKAARGNIAGAPPSTDSWYRTAMTLSWGP